MAGAAGEHGRPQADRSGGPRTRDDHVAAYLELEGVDLAHALPRAEDARDAAASRVRADAYAIRGLALAAKRADKRLAFEQAGSR